MAPIPYTRPLSGRQCLPASTMTVQDDLRDALASNPAAEAFFATFDRTKRYAILYRVQSAERPETRIRRIKTLVTRLADGKKIHP